SDYAPGNRHAFIGDGTVDFANCLRALDPARLHSITLECSPAFVGEDATRLTHTEFVARLKTARERLKAIMTEAWGGGRGMTRCPSEPGIRHHIPKSMQ
ncbi:MAG: hypothetical protein JXA57_08625, partial [Armatimonadetes bacterium]|nr:hypothetical protein [Armatimonadota bacterium]